MNSYTAIIFGISGVCFGIAIPAISDRIVIYKSQKREFETPARSQDQRVRIFLALLNGFLWTYMGYKLDDTFTAFMISMLFTAAILISVIDLRIRLIPNELVLLVICLGIFFQINYFGWMALLYASFCMVLVGFLFVFVGRIVGFEKVGAGDIKLIAAMGLVLGYPNIKTALIGMSLALLVFCIGGLALKKLTLYSTFPFAPFIMLGAAGALIHLIQ